MHKDTKTFIRELEQRGWRLVSEAKHLKLAYGNRLMVVSATPSCKWWLVKAQKMAKRIEAGASE